MFIRIVCVCLIFIVHACANCPLPWAVVLMAPPWAVALMVHTSPGSPRVAEQEHCFASRCAVAHFALSLAFANARRARRHWSRHCLALSTSMGCCAYGAGIRSLPSCRSRFHQRCLRVQVRASTPPTSRIPRGRCAAGRVSPHERDCHLRSDVDWQRLGVFVSWYCPGSTS